MPAVSGETTSHTVTEVDRIAEAYVEAFAALDPLAATRLGIDGHESCMTDFGPEGVEARADLARRTLLDLRATDGPTEAAPLAAAVMAERLRADLDAHDAGEWRRDLNVLSSPLQHVRETFDLMATETVEDWVAVADRLEAVPRAVDGIRVTLGEGMAAGQVAARRQAVGCAAQARVWAGGTAARDPYFAGLVGRAPAGVVDGTLRRRLEHGARAAGAAYGGLADWLETEYAPAAAVEDGVGAERYGLLARAWNGIDLDLDETYRWGWEELHRIEGDLARVADRILPGQPLGAVKHLLDTDPARSIEGEEALRRWLQDLMDRAIAGLDRAHFDVPAPLRRLEAMIAPPGGAAAQYYTGPSEDFRRPGRTWYPTLGRTRFPVWGEVSTAYHEGVPGHHLQIGMTQYLKDRLNRFQRTMASTAGHGEGWALYAERLMGELGYLENPDHELGMLSGQAMRAARVVVDLGLHLGLRIPEGEAWAGERWTPELAAGLLTERASQPPAFVASEVDRYLGMPGQAISYKVGERVWLEGREAARSRAGPSFDLKEFHACALALGPMGLGELAVRLGHC